MGIHVRIGIQRIQSRGRAAGLQPAHIGLWMGKEKLRIGGQGGGDLVQAGEQPTFLQTCVDGPQTGGLLGMTTAHIVQQAIIVG
ncbi:hypothetical protein Q6D67_09720 [Haliea sp. E1-2-M8]|nr:hypothetical protein [Haliea sp. E1-2-M8]MDO8861980.1 hypothetical protein [Haliea sp. E1-2-M8]